MYISSDNILTREECSLTPLFPNSDHGVQSESKGVKFKESDDMVYGYIYKIVNMLNDKVYIGQTTQNPYQRRSHHFYKLSRNQHENSHLQNSFNKYNESNFKFTVLNYATSKEVLDQLEDDYIVYYDCLNRDKGYNFKRGGANGKPSPETCKKISESNKGKVHSEKHRKNISEGLKGEKHHFYGKHLSVEHREKISEAIKGTKHPFYGKTLSESHRKNISESNKGKIFSIQHRKNIGKAKKGKSIHSLETRKKLSEFMKGENNPMYGIKGEMHHWYGKKHTKETKRKMGKSQRGKGLFGFTGAIYDKKSNPEKRCWTCRIKFNGKLKSLWYHHDPLSCQLIHDLVLNAIYGVSGIGERKANSIKEYYFER